MPVHRNVVTQSKLPAWSRRTGREKVPVEEQRKQAAQEKQKEKEKTQDFMKWHLTELEGSREFNARVADDKHVRSVTVPDTSHIRWSRQEGEENKEESDGSGVQHSIEGGVSKRLAASAEDSQEPDVAD